MITVTHQPSHYGSTAAEMIAAHGWFGFMRNFLLGGIAVALQYQVIDGITTLGGLLLAPVRALGQGLVLLVSSTIGNVVKVFDAGTQATILSFTDGVAAFLGPLAQPTAVGVGMLSIGVFIFAINRLRVSPLSFYRSISR